MQISLGFSEWVTIEKGVVVRVRVEIVLALSPIVFMLLLSYDQAKNRLPILCKRSAACVIHGLIIQ